MATTFATTRADSIAVEVHPSHRLPRPLRNNSNETPSASIVGAKIACSRKQQYTLLDSRPSSRPRTPSMPVSTGSQSSLLASLPSFMSVFGDGPDNQRLKEVGPALNQAPSKPTNITPSPLRTTNITTNTAKRPNSANHFFSPALRRDSASTFESVESSPTTTISTIESSLTEPSPSSSPESPNLLLPSSPRKYQRANSTPVTLAAMELKDQFSSSFPTLPGLDRSESPNKKMRNMKNLSVNTSASNRQASQLSRISLPNTSSGPSTHASSAPPTPAFIVPPKPARKKPSLLGLSISTPDSSNQLSQDRPVLVPQTPSDPQIRTLRLLQKDSTAPLFSPTHAPEGGMRLPPLKSAQTTTRFGPSARPPLSISPLSSFDTTHSSPIRKQTLDHVPEEPDYELPLSQEAKSPAYPQGPICIYDPNVYLYLEPSDVEARDFDVVLNVAREVKNPFLAAAEKALQSQTPAMVNLETQTAHLAGRESVSEPHTAVSEKSFSSAFETKSDDAAGTAPGTPKAVQAQPEYIHVPWDHNTNVVDDLLRLCELIDDRVRQEKRVLVHCQCGVSRSASLVVAYGLYKNPQLTVQEAYDAVKNRSRWIGPNMNLIYQLSEFKNKLAKSTMTGIHAWPSWRSLAPARTNPSSSLIPEVPLSLRAVSQKSLSAPSQLERPGAPGRVASFNFQDSTQPMAEPRAGDITPGPSSAPPGMGWSPETKPADLLGGSLSAVTERPKSQLLPSLMDIDTDLLLSPLAVGAEGIEQKETPPAGAVASDLQEVAKDLEDKTITVHEPAATSPSKPIGIDSPDDSSPKSQMGLPTTLKPRSDTASDQSSPSLPAGFSSLLIRRQKSRQNMQSVPLRQAMLRFAPPQIAQSSNLALHDDVPPMPSLLSPRAAEFTASPFHRTVAGDLAGSSVFEQGLMSPRAVDEDPRSPPQVVKAPITRNIFDMIDFDKTPR